jgi:hypothetical protein
MARLSTRRILIGVCALVLAMSAGCYRRVVSAKGIGADRYDVYDSKDSSSQLDRLFTPMSDQVRGGDRR